MSFELFTKKMQKATREVHALSDSLVNAKLALASSDNKVWVEGLLVFYEIFRYLEEAMDRLPNTFVSLLCIDGMKRTEAFEEDLSFYLTSEWRKNYEVRESVAKYLLHLQRVEARDPDLLMAYIYHLYMGLLTGGQILTKKRLLLKKLLPSSISKRKGHAITSYGDRLPSDIKQQLRATMNNMAESFSDEMKEKLIEESKTVFLQNNELIKSIQGSRLALLKQSFIAVIILAMIYLLYWYFF